MKPLYQISIIDQSGVEQALDFDYRHQNKKSLYHDVRVAIKKVFTEKIELIKDLFPIDELTFNVNLEQEKKMRLMKHLPVLIQKEVEGVFIFFMFITALLGRLRTANCQLKRVQFCIPFQIPFYMN